MPKTASELMLLFTQLPESEQALMLERLTASPSVFDDQRFTENYKGLVIEVYRSEIIEKISGPERWTSFYINSDGEQIHDPGVYRSSEECLKIARDVVTWELEQAEMLDSLKTLIQQFRAKGITDGGILNALGFAIEDMFEKSDWRDKVTQALEQASTSAWEPGRTLP